MVGASTPGGFELEDREASPVEVSRAVPASHQQHGPAATDRRDAFRGRAWPQEPSRSMPSTVISTRRAGSCRRRVGR